MDKELEEILDEFCGSNKMYRDIVDEVVEDSQEYDGEDDREKLVSRLDEITTHGCASGTVSSLIYYDDTTNFFNTYYDEIYDYLTEMDGEGLEPMQALKNSMDDVSIMMCDRYSKNFIVWMVYEEVCYRLLNTLENE